jgi:hypothetical protein
MRNLLISLATSLLALNVLAIYHIKRFPEPPAEFTSASQIAVVRSLINEIVEPEVKPEIVPDFVKVQRYRNPPEDSVLGDIIAHSRQAQFGNAHGRSTNAHETTHGINSEVRNEHTRRLNKRMNAFYVLKGRAVVIEEPNIRKHQVALFVPQSLRSYRYRTYISGQSAWDDTPLYIFDEWRAYVNGGMCNVEDVQRGVYRGGWTDGVSGCLDFSIYSIATAMAVAKHDNSYWQNNEQFRAFLIWNLKESYKTYMLGSRMDQFKWSTQDDWLRNLRTSPDAAEMREFINTHLEGIWLEN